jgi:alpha-glucosidase (family GH31 glycosyl hydrolase)
LRQGAVLLASVLLSACAGGGSDPATPNVKVERSADRITIATRALSAEVGLPRFRWSTAGSEDGEPLTAEGAAGGFFYERRGTRYELGDVLAERDIVGGVELDVTTSEAGEGPALVTIRFVAERTLEITIQPPSAESLDAVGERLEAPSGERYYGLTERLRDSPPLSEGVIDIPVDDFRPVEVGSLDRRGERVEMYVRPTIAVYAPFYHSSRGYGLYVGGTSVGAFDLAQSDPDALSFRFESGLSDESRRLRFYVFYGPEHGTILDEYTRLTGRPTLPAEWAFRHWRWRGELRIGEPALLDGVATNADVVEDVTMYEQLGIPAGVYLFDRPVLAGEFGFARFAWDETRVPNPRETLAALQRRGYHSAIWSATWACGSMPGDNGLEAQSLGLNAPGPVVTPRCADAGGGSFILDVTKPATQTWFRDKLAAFLADYGIAGIKLDRGEEHIPSSANDVWADGRNGREVRNDYPNLQARIHHEALQQAFADGEFVLTARTGYAGSQQHTIVWGGDTAGSETFGAGAGTDLGLRSAIISQLRCAFLGFPIWGSDTGGYYQFKDRDVFARWLELSAFSGIMEIGGVGPHAPWNMPTEPHYDDEMIDIYRRYTRLRETLHGYIVAAATEAATTGMPIARPLVFLDRTDPMLADLWDQYLFGPDLMVAPVWRIGQRERSVYFPAGRWRSYWNDDEEYEGPLTVTVAAPLDTIPVYVRRGARVPRPE